MENRPLLLLYQGDRRNCGVKLMPRPESKARFVNVRAGGVYQGLNDLAVQNANQLPLLQFFAEFVGEPPIIGATKELRGELNHRINDGSLCVAHEVAAAYGWGFAGLYTSHPKRIKPNNEVLNLQPWQGVALG